MKRSLFARTLPALLTIAFLSLFGGGAIALVTLRSLYATTQERSLMDAARLAANLAANAVSTDSGQSFCRDLARGTSFRVTLVGKTGIVVGDSSAEPEDMDNHAGRPEIARALRGEEGVSDRRSATLGVEMIYAAEPVRYAGAIVGAIRLSYAVPELNARLSQLYIAWSVAALALFAVGAAVSVRSARAIAAPVSDLARRARDWASGNLESRAGPSAIRELDALADTMNTMASDLSARMAETERQRADLAAVLDSIGEAVIAIDAGKTVRFTNPGADALKPADNATDSSLLGAFRNSDLDAIASRCIASRMPEEGEVTFYGDAVRAYLVYAAPLPDGGVVLVLNDITDMRRLENVRRDFVANVSHELKTPITLIKGFVENLQEASLDDPAERTRLLGIIDRNAGRLNAIVDDLLTLARLERNGSILAETEPVDARSVVEHAVVAVATKAGSKGIDIAVECAEGMVVQLNEGLMEQALINLLDNAIKFSPNGSIVRISAKVAGDGLLFAVRDQGIGIPARDAHRVFERFYRVDRGRGRAHGGTGLGLAIVKHIAHAHGGEVSVRSREGEGSEFTIALPLRVIA